MNVFWGKIIAGQKRGRNLGFPTANMPVHREIPEGIYASRVRFKDEWYQALTFIGRAVTFGATKVFAESYLLDFSGNLYGEFVIVKLLKKIRGNEKFRSADELIEQMNKDLSAARKFFTS